MVISHFGITEKRMLHSHSTKLSIQIQLVDFLHDEVRDGKGKGGSMG